MRAKDNSPYQRGRYWLGKDERKDGSLRSPFLTIFWYDDSARRIRSRSTGSADVQVASNALDRLYLEKERGQAVCPTCGHALERGRGHLVTVAIADYLLDRQNVTSISALRARLSLVVQYLDASNDSDVACDRIDERWISAFRKWAAKHPMLSVKGNDLGSRTAGTIEGSVRAFSSAINFAFARKETLFPAAFTAKKPAKVSVTPLYRADIATLAKMFSYALARNDRQSLLRFLQISLVTWCRPDAAHDFSVHPDRRQWLPDVGVVQLNPKGREQTRKYRPSVPVGDRFSTLLRDCTDYYVGVKSVRKAFEAMSAEIGLPGERESGLKLIRRSIAHIVRRRIGEEHWIQGEMMLGHRKASISDLYALPDTANLGRALAATNEVIEEIETLARGAFSRQNTGLAPGLRSVKSA
jgi:hypothetical protein